MNPRRKKIKQDVDEIRDDAEKLYNETFVRDEHGVVKLPSYDRAVLVINEFLKLPLRERARTDEWRIAYTFHCALNKLPPDDDVDLRSQFQEFVKSVVHHDDELNVMLAAGHASIAGRFITPDTQPGLKIEMFTAHAQPAAELLAAIYPHDLYAMPPEVLCVVPATLYMLASAFYVMGQSEKAFALYKDAIACYCHMPDLKKNDMANISTMFNSLLLEFYPEQVERMGEKFAMPISFLGDVFSGQACFNEFVSATTYMSQHPEDQTQLRLFVSGLHLIKQAVEKNVFPDGDFLHHIKLPEFRAVFDTQIDKLVYQHQTLQNAMRFHPSVQVTLVHEISWLKDQVKNLEQKLNDSVASPAVSRKGIFAVKRKKHSREPRQAEAAARKNRK